MNIIICTNYKTNVYVVCTKYVHSFLIEFYKNINTKCYSVRLES